MRMWMVPTALMCRQHLLGEHKEIHMLMGSMRARRSIDWHLIKNQVDPLLAYGRHMELVLEMKRRGYKHKSPIDAKEWAALSFAYMVDLPRLPRLDSRENLRQLYNRCAECRARQGVAHGH